MENLEKTFPEHGIALLTSFREAIAALSENDFNPQLLEQCGLHYASVAKYAFNFDPKEPFTTYDLALEAGYALLNVT